MDYTIIERLAMLFAEAERENRCVVCSSSSRNRKAILRRIPADFVAPMRGIFARRSYWDALNRTEQALHLARTLALLHPSWVFCGPTAAAAHGLETPYTLLKTIYIASAHSSYEPSRIRHLNVAPFDVVCAQGIPATDPLTSAIDSLRVCAFPEALAVADSALRKLSLPLADFQAAVNQRSRGRRNAAVSRKAAVYADGLSENGGESYARGVMIEGGFRVPQLQVEMRDPIEPDKTYRVDYLWRDRDKLIIGELDGREKIENQALLEGRTTASALREERTRESRLSITGARIVRFRFNDVLDREKFYRTLHSFGVPLAK